MRKFIIIAAFLALVSCEKNNSVVDPPLNNDLQRFLITEAEMPGYELKRQVPFEWIIADGNQMYPVIQQKWHIAGTEENNNIYIEYCEFATEPEAIYGTAYTVQSYETPSIRGTPTGSIIGDNSWAAINGRGIFFLRANIGIKISLWANFNDNDLPLLLSLSNKLANKIESNLSPEIIAFEATAKKKQIPEPRYQQITEPLVNSHLMNGFSLHSTWDSKWLISSDNIAMGIRKEWKDARGAIIGIDICQFAADSVAAKTSDIQGRISYSSVFRLENLDSLKAILAQWQNWWHTDFSKRFFSAVGMKGTVAVFVYQFEPSGVDGNFFYAIIEKLAQAI